METKLKKEEIIKLLEKHKEICRKDCCINLLSMILNQIKIYDEKEVQ
ncbi:MAG: hypothetical protein KKF56_05180 [Nanoarchaeota archaeon]|nr:hypothetical protein [Nanoarchaeota archaeon]